LALRSTAEIEKQIAARVREFDLLALLRLLYSLGWQPHELLLRSHHSNASQLSLIESIEFSTDPVRAVRITLNLGLLSAQSPLPSYFMKKMDTGEIEAAAFADFLGYFDHLMLRNYLAFIYAEANTQLFPDWDRTKRRYLHFLNLKSCATLHWLFQLIFPELRLRAEKVVVPRGVKMMPLRLGEVELGSDAVFGKKSTVQVVGRRVTLFGDEEIAESGQPWPAEITRRLQETILPILSAVGVDLEIFLVVRAQKAWAKLRSESYLGYDKIRGGDAHQRRIKVFSGHVVS
jgi:hypothetical protein